MAKNVSDVAMNLGKRKPSSVDVSSLAKKPLPRGGTIKLGSKVREKLMREGKTKPSDGPNLFDKVGENLSFVGNKIGDAFPKKAWTDRNTQQIVLGALPMLAGLVFDGTRGAAVGGRVGVNALNNMKKQKAAEKKAEQQFFENAYKMKDLDIKEKKADRDTLYLQATLGEKAFNQGLKAKAFEREAPLIAARTQKLKADAKMAGMGGKPAADQRKAAGFSRRMTLSEEIMDSLISKGFDPTSRMHQVKSFLPGELQSPQWQQYKNAGKNWVTANLRQESGAAIPPAELDAEFEKYFPQPGDSSSLVAQKRLLRGQAALAMQGSSGSALDSVKQLKAGENIKITPRIKLLMDRDGISAKEADAILKQYDALKKAR